jgi:hypothetical protein
MRGMEQSGCNIQDSITPWIFRSAQPPDFTAKSGSLCVVKAQVVHGFDVAYLVWTLFFEEERGRIWK